MSKTARRRLPGPKPVRWTAVPGSPHPGCGAAQTPTRRLGAGRLRPAAGRVSGLGIDALADPVAAKRDIAWVSDEPMIYDKLTPFEYLEFVAGLWSMDAGTAEARARELIEWPGLAPHAHGRCQRFPNGMLQKVAQAVPVEEFKTRSGVWQSTRKPS